MGRSKWDPDLGSEAGDMETTTLVLGQGRWELKAAVLIRSRDSEIAVSVWPTT